MRYMLCLYVALLCAGRLWAGEFITPPVKDTTAPDAKVQCTIDTMEWDGNNFTFAGTVYNKSDTLSVSFAQVTITLKDSEGALIVTQNYEATPSRLEPNESGKIGATINCEGRQPARVEYQASAL
ncbi:MAG: hypothetical protein EOM20_05690 [Spartobacteria bacterium]|nr:hypothetical protein [Spartobacteria bacterium]